CHNAPLSPSPQCVMTETTLSKKMRAFDGEGAIGVAQLYLARMLQHTLPVGFIAPCLCSLALGRISDCGRPSAFAQCLNLEHEIHQTASQLCILGFEPLE